MLLRELALLHVLFLFLVAMASASAAVPAPFFVECVVSSLGVAASFTLKVHPVWAPLGSARFRDLVEARFYDDQRFFRVLDGLYDIWIAQVGMHGDPAQHRVMESRRIKDDARPYQSNKRGTVSFATSGPNTRTR